MTREEREAELRDMLLHAPGRRWVNDSFLDAYEYLPLPPIESDDDLIRAILAKEFPDEAAGGVRS